ncbi:DUF1499 domain-containing protein [Vibrio sp. CAIM 722]|uniref:DUF1499 domain-containing protein n=3 Tax=Vibrionaceae TaxID=641 RepID=A0A7X4RSP1_9VIBR|nr:DUF1499 domain-containing protein [Vibrio nitrifigilis]MZI91776.1 DUF1499 domain-containing protein [Vibrio eleionomae]
MIHRITLIICCLMLGACSQGIAPAKDRTDIPCSQKASCVSTSDSREDFYLAPYILRPGVTLDQVKRVVLTLPGTKIADRDKDSQYLRVECTSKILRIVDDLELKLTDFQLVVRSQSRADYPDFGANRRRAETLRDKLDLAGLLDEP